VVDPIECFIKSSLELQHGLKLRVLFDWGLERMPGPLSAAMMD
jgi:hypothetical protein